MIKVSGLNKYYNKGKSNELHVINNTTIELPDTGLICILGESGSGKTTLMNTISGLDDFESGTIDVDGTQVNKYGDANQERVRNEKFGYIFQNYYLLQDRTVEYNLMISLGLYNITEEEKAERIDYVLKAVDMWRYKKRLVSQLSGGQQQRIAIARALAKSPGVIFADEPTGNLDEANTMRIMGILKKVSKNCLVVVVTHEKSIADFFADRILWISDGRIQGDEIRTGTKSYRFVEDTNLYLGEYNKRDMSRDNVNIEVYDNGETPDVELKLICDNGKVYISIGDAKNVEILTSESEKKVIDGKKPVLELTDVEDLEYSLEELEYAKKPKLGFREIKDIALANIKAMGKRQIFLVISLLAMSVMIVLAVQDIMTILAVHEEDVVETDSHYIKMTMEKGSLVNTKEFMNAKKELMDAIRTETDIYDNIVMNPDTSLSYVYEGFTQLEEVETNITRFSFVPLDKLSEDDLYYGDMPKEDNEIVVDRWVLEQYVENSNELSNVINDIKHFVGKTLKTSNDVSLKITGIAESEQMSIYIKKEEISALSKLMCTFVTYSEFKEDYAPEYGGEELGLNEDGNYEALASYSEFMASYAIYVKSNHSKISAYESALSNYETMLQRREEAEARENHELLEFIDGEVEESRQSLEEAEKTMLEYYGVDTYEECLEIRNDYSGYTYEKTVKSGGTYTVVGFYDDSLKEEMNAELVIADEAEERVMTDIISYMGECFIYGENQQEIIDTIQSLKEASSNKLVVNLTNPYETLLDAYKADKAEQFNGRIIVTGTIFIVSMIILYFMMKANAVQRMQDLGVYRLIGISKGSIVGLFAFENVVITTYTSLVGALLSTFVTYLISSIPSLGIEINYPWYAFLITVLFLYGVNVIVGIMPIRKILKLPPAQLAAKYDI